MNYRGSYRKLLGNAISAIVAAIEIYNKPRFAYRDECVVILLLNAWELMLKAILSKNKESIFYPKRRREPYRTVSWNDALSKAEPYFPKHVSAQAVRGNLELLGTYRDNVVHFYNATDFSLLLYSLAQTSIVNFKDLLEDLFGRNLTDEITWRLLPLGTAPPIDPLTYISSVTSGGTGSPAERQFLVEVGRAAQAVKDAGHDSDRVLTIFDVHLRSIKKATEADVIVGVVADPGSDDQPLSIVRRLDPNVSHPLRTSDVLEEIGTLHGRNFSSYVFQAIAWKHQLKEESRFCWRSQKGQLTTYSRDVLPFIRRLTNRDLDACLSDYREHLRP